MVFWLCTKLIKFPNNIELTSSLDGEIRNPERFDMSSWLILSLEKLRRCCREWGYFYNNAVIQNLLLPHITSLKLLSLGSIKIATSFSITLVNHFLTFWNPMSDWLGSWYLISLFENDNTIFSAYQIKIQFA